MLPDEPADSSFGFWIFLLLHRQIVLNELLIMLVDIDFVRTVIYCIFEVCSHLKNFHRMVDSV